MPKKTAAKKRTPRKAVQPAPLFANTTYANAIEWEGKKFGEISMHAFLYTRLGVEYAQHLAAQVSTPEPCDNNIAIALLSAGVAAIETKGDRAYIAWNIIRTVMSMDTETQKSVNDMMQAVLGEEVTCSH